MGRGLFGRSQPDPPCLLHGVGYSGFVTVWVSGLLSGREWVSLATLRGFGNSGVFLLGITLGLPESAPGHGSLYLHPPTCGANPPSCPNPG